MGILRLILALSVIAEHAHSTIFGFSGLGAFFSVNFFFVISGFYMALVLNEKYANVHPLQFYKSRVLRLFPTYYLGIAIALIVMSEQIIQFYSGLSLSSKIVYVLQNTFIVGQDLSHVLCASTLSGECAVSVEMSINPPAWTLAVELYFYLAAPFLLRDPKKIVLFILFGALYLIFIRTLDLPLQPNQLFNLSDPYQLYYNFFPSSFVFFGWGALCYHFSKNQVTPHYFLILLIFLLLSYTTTFMAPWILFLAGLAIPVLFSYTSHNKIDRLVGELSYPAYILHFPILLFLRPYAEKNPEYFSYLSLGSWVAVAACVLGLLVYFILEKKVNIYRERITSESKLRASLLSPDSLKKLILWPYFGLPIVLLIAVYSFQYPLASTAENVNYGYWVNGMHARLSRMLIVNNSINERSFLTGAKIIFSDGSERTITNVQSRGPQITLFYSGAPLRGEDVGYPNEFKLVKDDSIVFAPP